MKEKDLYGKFNKKMKEADPRCFVYKIPDTFDLGGKKPFDTVMVTKGVPFAIEFKSETGIITKYQNYQLDQFKDAGGVACIFFAHNDMDKFIQQIIVIRDAGIKTGRR